jgi:hypothetical protein
MIPSISSPIGGMSGCRDGPREALRRTLDAKARPILCSSLVLIGVFLIFGLSSFPPVVDFGWLAAGVFWERWCRSWWDYRHGCARLG